MPRRLLTTAVLLLLIPTLAQAQTDLARKPALTLAAAKEIASAAAMEAARNQWSVVIAILDDGAHPIYLERMDDVQIGSVEVALAKARSAVLFRRPTKVFADRITEGGLGLMGLPGVMPVEGGVPIVVDGRVIGAIGVSGVTSQQDGVIAQAGADVATRLLVR